MIFCMVKDWVIGGLSLHSEPNPNKNIFDKILKIGTVLNVKIEDKTKKKIASFLEKNYYLFIEASGVLEYKVKQKNILFQVF